MTPAILRASVLTATDPLGQGRVKIRVPQATGGAGLWAEPLQPVAAVPPAAGSAVWVLFESGNPAMPVYIPTSVWGPWTAIPAAWLGAGWNPYTAGYRLGPASQVQFQGEVNTANAVTPATIANGALVLTLPGALQPSLTSSVPVGILPGTITGTAVAVLRVNGATITAYGGPWTYTGITYLSLAALSYVTVE